MKTVMTKAMFAIAMMTAIGSQSQAEGMKIRLATEGAFAPFNFMGTDGKPQGFDVDLGNALCEEMKADCEWVVQDWDGMIPGLKAKKYDAIIAQMSVTEERKKEIDFSDAYAVTPSAFITTADSGITDISPEALKGKVIGTQSSTIQANYLETYYKDSEIKLYGTQDEANLDLANGRLDAVTADKPVLEEYLTTDSGACCQFVGKDYYDIKIMGVGVGIGVRKGEDELRMAMNKALEAIIANGTYKTINDKYFSYDISGR